ncbi:MAG: endonuclease domain-containing protein [bacterium]|nr:endonuclease domain-containing protein [bacterium]
MKAFVSHGTALSYWRMHFPLDSEIGQPSNSSSAEECAARKYDVLECVPETFRTPGEPIDILVFSRNARRDSRSTNCHLWSSATPDNAFYRVGDMMVSSPELVFLQMASQLSIAQLVALGCELCGQYVLDPRGISRRGHRDACTTRVAPLTNTERIGTLLAASSRVPGLRNALRALKYVVEGSRSPMETMTCLLLALPGALGGYGFERPVMNAHIDLDDEARMVAQRSYCEGDICWPEHKLDIEYHGEVHADAARMRSDFGRAIGIERMGWRVLTVTSAQVLDMDRFEVVAREVARRMKRPMRRSIVGHTSQRLALRQELEEWTFGTGF